MEKQKVINRYVYLSIPMTEKVLSTKVSREEVEIIKNIADERGKTISALLRELIDEEIKGKIPDWTAACFGTDPRDDEPKSDSSIDEVLYGR